MIDPEYVYRRTTPNSRALYARAVKAMPGGTTRTTTYFDPYPLYIDRGEGCRIWDVDGTERIDMLGNYSAMIQAHWQTGKTTAWWSQGPVPPGA